MRNLLLCSALSIAATVSLGVTEAGAQQLDREVGVDFRYGNVNINNPLLSFFFGDDDATLLGLDVHGKFRVGDSLWVGGRIPVAHMRWNEDGATTLGNITATLSYRLTNYWPSSSWIDTSLSFPTADDDGEGAFVSNAFALFWIPDPALYLPNTTGISVLYRHSLERAKQGIEFSGGVQVLAIDGADDRLRFPLRVAGHVNLGSTTQAVGRFSTVWLADAQDGEDDFLHVLEAGLLLQGVGQGSLDIMVYYPLDELYRDALEVFGLMVGFKTGI